MNRPTAHEQIQMGELIRMELLEVQKLKATLPMVTDEELRAEITACIQTATTHLKTMTTYCQNLGLTQAH